MNNFSWTKALGFGVLIWLVMFAASSALAGFGVSISTGWGITLALLAGVLSFSFALNINADNSAKALEYGLVFAVLGILLDLLISYRFAPQIFSAWVYWAGYALVLFAPWVGYEVMGGGAHPKPV